jgi:hypothetical protein
MIHDDQEVIHLRYPHTWQLMWESAHQLLSLLSFIAGGIMDFIAGLKFEDFRWFLGMLLLVLFCPVLNWGSVLDFGSLGLPLWDPGPGALGFGSLGSGLCGLGSVGFGSLGSGLRGSTWWSSGIGLFSLVWFFGFDVGLFLVW